MSYHNLTTALLAACVLLLPLAARADEQNGRNRVYEVEVKRGNSTTIERFPRSPDRKGIVIMRGSRTTIEYPPFLAKKLP